MGYSEALTAAGANILAFEQIGSYQGDWFAKVIYQDKELWIHGSYGSCSGCDAFEAEFSCTYDENGCKEHRYENKTDCAACIEHNALYQTKLAEFGKSYLESGDMTKDEVIAYAETMGDWDDSKQETLAFIAANA